MKKIITTMSIVLLCTSMMFATVADLKKNMEDFNNDIENSLVSASVNQNIYADAYIGKVFPSLPPHFGIGANASFTQLDITELKKAANLLGIDTLDSLDNKTYLPFISADVRVGGIILPFDIGASFMKLNFKPLGIDYVTFGADVRIPVIQQGVIAPNLSIGASYYRTSVNFNQDDMLFSKLEMDVIALNAQLSKQIFFLTPFVGGRYVIHKSNNSYETKNPLYSVKESFTSEFSDNNSFLLFGGLSFDIFIVPITASVSYDVNNKIVSGVCSVRVQL